MTRKTRPLPTLARLKELLDYNPRNGVFTCRVARGKLKVGDPAGGYNTSGYLVLCIDCVEYYGHRLAWLYVTGEDPGPLVDHKDLCPGNNHFENLRPATKQENQRNCRPRSHNKTGAKGVVHVDRCKSNPFRAVIRYEGKPRHLGYFATFEEARDARKCATALLFGDFGGIV